MMKTMKYYLKNIFLAASCLWLFTACNDFLTLYPEDDIVDVIERIGDVGRFL